MLTTSNAVDVALQPVHFSIQYRLRNPARSRTLTTLSPEQPPQKSPALSDSPLLSTNDGQRLWGREVSNLRSLDAVSSSESTQLYERDGAGDTLRDPLSTFDKRELSKVVIRDAVYAVVMDLLPSRRYVQTAAWTLEPQLLQIDGAVAVVQLRDEEQQQQQQLSRQRWGSSLGGRDVGAAEGLRAEVVSRVVDLIRSDSGESFPSGTLRPYLGEQGCRGYIELAVVDGAAVVRDGIHT